MRVSFRRSLEEPAAAQHAEEDKERLKAGARGNPGRIDLL